MPGLYVNGQLTENENIADIGGVKNSYNAYSKWIGDSANLPSEVDGLSNIQLFFVSYAQGWCEVATPQVFFLDLFLIFIIIILINYSLDFII